jgi:hypothetical protein
MGLIQSCGCSRDVEKTVTLRPNINVAERDQRYYICAPLTLLYRMGVGRRRSSGLSRHTKISEHAEAKTRLAHDHQCPGYLNM